MKLGAQFYTIRQSCKDLENLALSMKKVADIGYTTIQLSATCAFDPEWMKAELAKNGLKCVVTHADEDRMQNDAAALCAEHKVFGCDYIGLGHFNFKNGDEEELYADFCNTYRPVAQNIRKNGLKFMYHNHAAEFRKIGGKTILRKMAEDFSADELGFIPDTFWIQAGGANPAEYIRELKGRVPCVHLKDYRFTTEAIGKSICAIGDGNINFDAVAEACEYAGTEYLLVEQDICHGEDPFDCLRRSYEYLKAMGLE